MKILLLDDRADRANAIEKLAQDYDSELITSHSVEDAKMRLSKDNFDIIIIDLYTNYSSGYENISKVAGLQIITEIFDNVDIKPCHREIIVVSDNLSEIGYMSNLMKYPVTIIDTKADCEWIKVLKKRFEYVLDINAPIDLAIVTAVDVEFNSIYDETWTLDKEDGGLQFYYKKVTNKNNKAKKMILVQAEKMGMSAASYTVCSVLKNYCPKCLCMIGVAAGNAKDTGFGDIIVASETCDYSFGAIVEKNGNTFELESEQTRECASEDIIAVFNRYKKNQNLQFEIRRNTKMTNKYKEDIKIHIGMLATGPAVIKSKLFVEQYIKEHNRKYLGIDMETYAVYYMCKKLKPNMNYVSIKSVCDHADKDKSKEHQEYCARLSAELLMYYVKNDL